MIKLTMRLWFRVSVIDADQVNKHNEFMSWDNDPGPQYMVRAFTKCLIAGTANGFLGIIDRSDYGGI